ASYEKLDLMHVHYAIPHATSAFLARQVLGPLSPRVLLTLHGTDITLVGNDPSFLPITRFSILHADAVTAPSEYLRRATYQNLSIDESAAPIEVIPNFVDEELFCPAAARDPGVVRRLFRSAGDAPVLLHNSKFRPLKRVDDAVRVLAEVRRQLPAVLVLVG